MDRPVVSDILVIEIVVVGIDGVGLLWSGLLLVEILEAQCGHWPRRGINKSPASTVIFLAAIL
jgi:hypothetical protein